MSFESPQRRLAAIVVADMVGYSRQMERDEAGTVQRLQTDRTEFIDPTIAAYHGRIVRMAGDGALVEFPSAVKATQCAIDLQRGMSARNSGRDKDDRIVFRMGVNTGDIIVEDDNLHGEGINVAARLESLCEPGEILLSEETVHYVDGKVDAGLEFVEERSVKNIERPVRIWRIAPCALTADRGQPTAARADKRRWRQSLLIGGALVVAIGGIIWYQPWAPHLEAIVSEHWISRCPTNLPSLCFHLATSVVTRSRSTLPTA